MSFNPNILGKKPFDNMDFRWFNEPTNILASPRS